MLDQQIEFRRCPGCRRVEKVGTGEPVAEGCDHQLCTIPQENWVHFTAPADWCPSVSTDNRNG